MDVTLRRLAPAVMVLAGWLGCAPLEPKSVRVPSVPLVAGDGRTRELGELVAGSRLTVLVFFSPHCPCLSAHEPRLRALYEAYHPRGVDLVVIDPGMFASPSGAAEEARTRSYPFPILVDQGGRLAGLVAAEYATYSVVLDSTGTIRYHGGIDSDRTRLHDDAIPYLRNALDDLLDGRPPRLAESKTLGCSLETW